jgi:uncharacterized membrane protein YjdF
MFRIDPSLRAVGAFSAAYLLLATPFAIAQHNTEFLFYIGIVIVFATIVILVHRAAHLSQAALWALSFWGLFHMLGGLLRLPEAWPTDGGSHVLYSLWLIPGYLKYDQVIHAYGFGVSTLVCWEYIKTIPGVRPTFGVLVLCALAGMGLGAINEIVEFTAVLMIPGTNVGGYENTGWDLVANLTGSTLSALFIRYGMRHPRVG